jgi:hypothetical protein
MEANFNDCPLTLFVRALKATKALSGVEVLAGAAQLPRQTAPWRIVTFPTTGDFVEAGDETNLFDVQQPLVAELWAQGSTSGANPDEATLQDWNAVWALLVRFMQALSEQAANPQEPTAPGTFWEAVGGPEWGTATDTSQQGVSIKVMCQARCAIPAASNDQGHVGDNWPQGTAESVAINGAP